MATLHGILAELGIESPTMHPEREVEHDTDWTANEDFVPVEGKSYQVVFAKLNFDGQHRHALKNVRIDGPEPSDWFDLDEGKPLDTDLQSCVVQAFRPID
jgi:hypothetical protein